MPITFIMMTRRSNTPHNERKRGCVFVQPLNFIRNYLDDTRDDRDTSNGDVRSCYRLNLSDCGDPSNSTPNSVTENHKNVDVFSTPLQAAIQTAKIFNGIVVGDDGILLSRSERGKGGNDNIMGTLVKEGQSRQAVKIEQIIQATDDHNFHILGNRKGRNIFGNIKDNGIELEQNESPPKSQLLVVLGEYDNINHLVTKGAEKLRNKKSLCWLPPSVLNRAIDFCSPKDAINLSQSCKLMRQTMKGCTNFHGQIRALRTELKLKGKQAKARTYPLTQKVRSALQAPKVQAKKGRILFFQLNRRGHRQKQSKPNSRPE